MASLLTNAAAGEELPLQGGVVDPQAEAEFNRTVFIALAGLLLGFGLFVVHSASVTSRPTEFEQIHLSRHLVFIAIGLVAAGIAAAIPARIWVRAAPWLLLGVIILLVLVLVPGIGVRVKGARRWIRFAGFTLQPSELAKIALPLWVAARISLNHSHGRPWSLSESLTGFRMPLLIPPALVMGLVALQPDLGTTLFLAGGVLLTLFIGGLPLRYFGYGLVSLIPASLGVFLLKDYQLRRITGFLDTWSDWREAPYQLKQSLVTLGSGGWTGVGLGMGYQKLSFLPEANTDFVFAVIGEELGLLGTLSLLLLWGSLFYFGLRLIRTGRPTDNEITPVATLASFVLLSQLVGQALLNIAVVTAMVPPKGISHPLISAGGSNLVVSLVSLGLILSLTRRDNSPGLPGFTNPNPPTPGQ
ncbi:MAG: cell division protein [Planctomyces sp.]|nr:cell division protein [Planctomyces sp.]